MDSKLPSVALQSCKVLLALFTFLLFIPGSVLAQLDAMQKAKIDSLKQVIATASHDTTKVQAYMDWNGLIYKTDYQKSIELMEKLLIICEEKRSSKRMSKTAKSKSYYKRVEAMAVEHSASMYDKQGEREKSLAYKLQALQIFESLGKTHKVGFTQYWICGHYEDDHLYEKAIDYCEKAVQAGRMVSDSSLMAKALLRKAGAYMVQGDYSNALETYNKSLQFYEALGRADRVLIVLNQLGRLYDAQRNDAKAIECFSRGLQVSQKLGDQRMISHCLNSLGYMYDNIGEFEKAKDFFSQSFETRKKVGEKQDIAGSLFNLGYINTKLGALDNALDYQKRSLALRRELGEPTWMAQSLNNLGNIYEAKSDFKEAINYYEQSLQITKESNREVLIPETLNLLAGAHQKQGDYKKAIAYSKDALNLARKQGVLSQIETSFYLQYQANKLQNNPSIALEMFEAYTEIQDSIQIEKNQREIIRQEYKYNYEKQAIADSLQNLEAQKLADAQLTAQKAQNTQQRQQSIFAGIGLLALLILSGFTFYRRRNLLQEKLESEQEEAKRLKELDQYKNKLYTNLTHEFRTPLTVILGMAEKLQTEPQKFITEGPPIIERNGKNLLRVINQLLDLSKLENDSFKLQMRQGEIVSYLRYILESFHSYANGENLAIRFYSNLETLQMDFDVEQIKQVMTNLISNAIKFTPAGGEVAVRVLKENDHLQIEVKDNGIGIPKEALPLIFDRFYQVDDSSTRAQEGTGIGLAHTKELLRLMDGEIGVESNYGKSGSDEKSGTVFTVSLPIRNNAPFSENIEIVESAVFIPKPEKAILASSNTAVTDKELPTVLIIEDNPDVVIYLKSCLEKNYQLEVAYNGTIGVETAIETVPDLIISDVMMPGKDGFEVCNILKTDERTSHIPIILLTAKADLSSKLEGLERGADAYLEKPFHQGELDIRLHKLLEGRQKMQHYFSNQYLRSSSDNNITTLELSSKDTQIEDAFLQKVNTILEANIEDEDFGLIELRRKVGMTRSPFYRKMKALTNTAPSDYIRSYRLRKARHLLEHTDSNVAEAAYAVGFKNPSYFTKVFQEDYGVAPGSLKR